MELFIHVPSSLLNGLNFILDEISSDLTYFYIQAQLFVEKNYQNPFYSYTSESIKLISERCLISESKGIELVKNLEMLGFVKKEKYKDVFEKNIEKIEIWNLYNKPPICIDTFEASKDFYFFTDLPTIPFFRCKVFEFFYNQEIFKITINNILPIKANFQYQQFKSFLEFKTTLFKHLDNFKLEKQEVLKNILTTFLKNKINEIKVDEERKEENVTKKMRMIKSKISLELKVFGKKYLIKDFSETFSQEYVNVLNQIEKDYEIPITELFSLVGRMPGIKSDLVELKRIFECYNSRRVVVWGFKSFIECCRKSKMFLETRRSYFLKSLSKFIENKKHDETKDKEVKSIKLKPIKKHELNKKIYELFELEYSDKAYLFRNGYYCPSCSTELTLEDIKNCPGCNSDLDWKDSSENLDLINSIVKEYLLKREKEINEKLLRKV